MTRRTRRQVANALDELRSVSEGPALRVCTKTDDGELTPTDGIESEPEQGDLVIVRPKEASEY